MTDQNKKQKLVKIRDFGVINDSEKTEILRGRKSDNTNKATECHVNFLRDYLMFIKKPCLDSILDEDLPAI